MDESSADITHYNKVVYDGEHDDSILDGTNFNDLSISEIESRLLKYKKNKAKVEDKIEKHIEFCKNILYDN